MNPAEKQLTEALEQAKQIIQRQKEEIDMLTAPPFLMGTVAEVGEKELIICSPQGKVIFEYPKANKNFKTGECVRITGGGSIHGKSDHYFYGSAAVVTRVLDEKNLFVEVGGNERLLILSAELAGTVVNGDRVFLDPTDSVVLLKIESETLSHSEKDTIDTVTWDMIGGQEEAKRILRESVELPNLYPELYAAYSKKPTRGVLLSGPPGCGKTMLAKALFHSISHEPGAELNPNGFIYVKGPEILSPYVGVAERNVREVFLAAKEYKKKTGKPAVVFIDEADAILGQRGKLYAQMEKTIVPQFLTEMDGLNHSSAIVVLSTNRPEHLDPAVVREGRIDQKVRVSRPTQEDSIAIFNMYLKKAPIDSGHTCQYLAKLSAEIMYSGEARLYEIKHKVDKSIKYTDFLMKHIASGSLVAQVVENAISIAIRRDISTGGNPSGINQDDVVESFSGIFKGSLDVNHDDAIRDVIGNGEILELIRS